MASYKITVQQGQNLPADYCGLLCTVVDKNGKMVSNNGKPMQVSLRGMSGSSPKWNFEAFKITQEERNMYAMKYIYIGVYQQKEKDKDKTKGKMIGKVKLRFKNLKTLQLKRDPHIFTLPLKSPVGSSGVSSKTKSSITVIVEVEQTGASNNRIGRIQNTPTPDGESIEDKASVFTSLPAFDLATQDSQFTSIRALWFTSFAQLAYKTAPVASYVLRSIYKMKKWKFFENFETDTQGFGAYNDQLMILSFRGTESKEDVLTDLDIRSVTPFPSNKIRVHSGFHRAYASVKHQVEKFVTQALKAAPSLKVYICGHSLGGALASLCCAYITLTPQSIPNKVNLSAVYTIGQPKVGNRSFVAAMNPINCFRIINYTDPIPKIGYGSHFGREVYINSKGKLSESIMKSKKFLDSAKGHLNAVSKADIKAILVNHTSGEYRKWIDSYIQKELIPSQFQYRDYVYINIDDPLELIEKITDTWQNIHHFRSFFGNIPNELNKFVPLLKHLNPSICSKFNMTDQLSIEAHIASITLSLEYLLEKSNEYHNSATIITEPAKHADFAHYLRKFAISLRLVFTNLKKLVNPPQPVQKENYDMFNLSAIYHKFLQSNTYISLQALEQITKTVSCGDYQEAQTEIQRLEPKLEPLPEFICLLNYLKTRTYIGLQRFDAAVTEFKKVAASPSATVVFPQIAKHDVFRAEINSQPQLLSLYRQIQDSTDLFYREIQKLSLDEVMKLSSIFREADTDGDRYLTASELKNYIKKVGMNTILELIGVTSLANPEERFNSLVENVNATSQSQVGLNHFLYIMSLTFQAEMEDSAYPNPYNSSGGGNNIYNSSNNIYNSTGNMPSASYDIYNSSKGNNNNIYNSTGNLPSASYDIYSYSTGGIGSGGFIDNSVIPSIDVYSSYTSNLPNYPPFSNDQLYSSYPAGGFPPVPNMYPPAVSSSAAAYNSAPSYPAQSVTPKPLPPPSRLPSPSSAPNIHNNTSTPPIAKSKPVSKPKPVAALAPRGGARPLIASKESPSTSKPGSPSHSASNTPPPPGKPPIPPRTTPVTTSSAPNIVRRGQK